MPTDAATAIAYVGAFVGLVGGGVALFNSWKSVCWKRAELANTYMKDFNNNPELVFAGRCLDWQGGKLIVPESLRAYLPDGTKLIDHDRRVYAAAVSPFLQIDDMHDDPRVQIYRTSLDMFLSWLALVASALDRKLFLAADIHDVGYWVAKIESESSYIRSSWHTDTQQAYKSSFASIVTRIPTIKTGCSQQTLRPAHPKKRNIKRA